MFERNIRGYLGEKTDINKGMVATLKDEPERFFFYNNGITIVCDEAEKKSSQGKDILQVGNPQIINGQQTTRTLAAFAQNAARASVLVKVFRVPRQVDGDGEAFEGLVSRIVQGTNWQNAIKPSDLMANDRRQIELQRALRKIGYLYLRKRQSKGEARSIVGRGQFYVVSKEELAQAVAGCDLDPVIIRSGRKNLFTEEYYDQTFPNSDPDYYLPRYRLMHEVTYGAKRQPMRGYAKWLVLNFMWAQLTPLIRGKLRTRAFRRLCEKQTENLVNPLYRAINLIFVQALRYYKKNRGEGVSAKDISLFFRNGKAHHLRFGEFWDASDAAPRKAFSKCLANIQDAVASFEE
ncbi:MAG: AIPR family protein [Planctomycetaceae bacterium]|nr:AIPR family protein [Planctomycetaceae bacterium]